MYFELIRVICKTKLYLENGRLSQQLCVLSSAVKIKGDTICDVCVQFVTCVWQCKVEFFCKLEMFKVLVSRNHLLINHRKFPRMLFQEVSEINAFALFMR